MVITVLVYLFAIITCTLLARLAKRTKNRIYLVLIIVVASFIAGCRAITVGNDTAAYYQMFASKGTWGFIREYAFALYIKISMAIFRNANVCLLFTSVLTNCFFIIGLWRVRERFAFDMTVFAYMAVIYFLTMSAVRQWLSLSIVMFAMSYLLDGKYGKYIISIIIASLFHYTTICALANVFIMHFVKQKRRQTWKDVLISTSLIAGVIVTLLIAIPIAKIEYSSIISELTFVSRGGSLMIIYRFIIAIAYSLHIYFLASKKDGIEADEEFEEEIEIRKFLDISFSLWTIIALLGAFFNNIARIGWVFMISQGLMFGSCSKAKDRMTFIVRGLLFVLFAYSIYSVFAADGNSLVPYTTFWQ